MAIITLTKAEMETQRSLFRKNLAPIRTQKVAHILTRTRMPRVVRKKVGAKKNAELPKSRQNRRRRRPHWPQQRIVPSRRKNSCTRPRRYLCEI